MTPLIETVYRLTSTGRHDDSVRAWTNPVYETSPSKPLPSDATITVQPTPGGLDAIEEVFSDGRKILRRMRMQFWAVVGLVVAHGMVIGYTDPLYTRAPLTQVIVYSVQVGLLIAIVMAFFVLTSGTLYVQLGRYDVYLREFAPLYGMFAAELALYVALKAYATVLLYQRMSYLALWAAPGYLPLWAVQRVVLLLFWAAAVYSSLSVFDAKYFDPDHLVGLSRQNEEHKRGRASAKR